MTLSCKDFLQKKKKKTHTQIPHVDGSASAS
jgi:hypothetical protein